MINIPVVFDMANSIMILNVFSFIVLLLKDMLVLKNHFIKTIFDDVVQECMHVLLHVPNGNILPLM